MLRVEDYARIRRAHRDGMSIREIARTFHHSRHKIRQVLEEPQPRRYSRSKVPWAPKLTEEFQRAIEDILLEDQQAPVKQRHTAAAIFRRLAQQGYQGGYDQVRRFVSRRRTHQRETFIPLCHDPGQRAEADFGQIYVDFPEGRRQVSVLLITWAYSNASFAIALPSEKTEAILHGTVEAFEFFGCVPKELWWDNPKTIATSILKGRQRELNVNYVALASHYTFEPLCCMPARGNEKPHVENRVKLLKRWWATPVPQVADWEDLNSRLRQRCQHDLLRTISGQSEPIGERFAHERAFAVSLPKRHFDPAISTVRKTDKYQTVAFEKNLYSVPRRYAFQTVMVKAYVDRLELVHEGQVIAWHGRHYGEGEQILDPLHYLVTLERKPACLDHTAVYRDWKLPGEFGQLREELESRHGRFPGARQYIRVLKLLAEHSTSRVRQAIVVCRRRGTLSADAIGQESVRMATIQSVLDHNMSLHGASPETHESTVQVPLPDLNKFDRFLSQGGQKDGQTNAPQSGSPPALESESQATSPTDDAGRVQQAGAGSSGCGPELLGLLAATDRTGSRQPNGQCAEGAYQTGRLSSLQGLGHV